MHATSTSVPRALGIERGLLRAVRLRLPGSQYVGGLTTRMLVVVFVPPTVVCTELQAACSNLSNGDDHPDAHLPICAIREPRKLKGTENRGGGESMGSEGGAGCPVSPIPPPRRLAHEARQREAGVQRRPRCVPREPSPLAVLL